MTDNGVQLGELDDRSGGPQSLIEYLDRAVELIIEIGKAKTRVEQAEFAAAALASLYCARWLIDGKKPERYKS